MGFPNNHNRNRHSRYSNLVLEIEGKEFVLNEFQEILFDFLIPMH